MWLRITASAFNERGPQFMEQALAAIHAGLRGGDALTLLLRRDDGEVGLACAVDAGLRSLVTTQLLAHYPSARVERSDDPAPAGPATWSAELALWPDVFALQRHPQFAGDGRQPAADPLAGILAALAGGERDPLRPRVDLIVRPATAARIRHARRVLDNLRRPLLAADPERADRYLRQALAPGWQRRAWAWWLALHAGPLSRTPREPASARTHDRETPHDAAHDKLRRRLFEVRLGLSVTAPEEHEERALAKLHELVGALGAFAEPHHAAWRLHSLRRDCPLQRRRGFLLSAEELATLWHLPVFSIRTPTLALAAHQRLEPPAGLPDPRRERGLAPLGRTHFREHRRPCGLRADDRRRHLYVVGKTGMGKSTLLANLLAEDVAAGRGCCLVDPHGDLAEALVARIPPRRTNDVILFDAGDQAHPLAFNPLADCPPEARPLVASGVLAAFQQLYGDSWGPRLEHIFRHCLLALLETPGASLVSVLQLLGDAEYRRAVVGRLRDPVVRAFWQREFAALPPKLQVEAVAPIQNKVGQFVASPLLRHILGQSRSTLDLRKVMDRGQVLVVNLSKGRVGEDASALLGSLLISSLQRAAMSRADVREAERPDFHLYVDEFQHFATASFAAILSEARKYRLTLTLAHQYLAQLDEATAAAVFGNVGSLVAFAVGAEDAERLAAQLGAPLSPEDLLALPKHEAYARLLVDGLPCRPFSLATAPPVATGDAARGDVIRRASRRRYGRPRATVAAEIARELAAAG